MLGQAAKCMTHFDKRVLENEHPHLTGLLLKAPCMHCSEPEPCRGRPWHPNDRSGRHAIDAYLQPLNLQVS